MKVGPLSGPSSESSPYLGMMFLSSFLAPMVTVSLLVQWLGKLWWDQSYRGFGCDISFVTYLVSSFPLIYILQMSWAVKDAAIVLLIGPKYVLIFDSLSLFHEQPPCFIYESMSMICSKVILAVCTVSNFALCQF